MGRITDADFTSLLRGGGPRVYVETGILHGEQLNIAVNHFRRVIGVEMQAAFVEECRALVQCDLIHGDSRIHVPLLAAELREPVFWLLDAHYCGTRPPDPLLPLGPLPLWDELRAIRNRPFADFVLVDDTHAFGTIRAEQPEWEFVTRDSLDEFMGRRGCQFAGGWLYVPPDWIKEDG